MISNIGALRTFSYSQLQNSQMGGKIYVPVPANKVMYTQFEYISGFAAQQTDQGISIDKVKILNTLIDQLISMKKTEKPVKLDKEMSTKQIDTLINTYQEKIKSTLAAAESNPYVIGGSKPQSGMGFSMTA